MNSTQFLSPRNAGGPKKIEFSKCFDFLTTMSLVDGSDTQ